MIGMAQSGHFCFFCFFYRKGTFLLSLRSTTALGVYIYIYILVHVCADTEPLSISVDLFGYSHPKTVTVIVVNFLCVTPMLI